MSDELIQLAMIVGRFLLVTFAVLHLLVLFAREQCSRLEVVAALGGAFYLFGLFGRDLFGLHLLNESSAYALRTVGLGWLASPYISPLAERVFKPRSKEKAATHGA